MARIRLLDLVVHGDPQRTNGAARSARTSSSDRASARAHRQALAGLRRCRGRVLYGRPGDRVAVRGWEQPRSPCEPVRRATRGGRRQGAADHTDPRREHFRSTDASTEHCRNTVTHTELFAKPAADVVPFPITDIEPLSEGIAVRKLNFDDITRAR